MCTLLNYFTLLNHSVQFSWVHTRHQLKRLINPQVKFRHSSRIRLTFTHLPATWKVWQLRRELAKHHTDLISRQTFTEINSIEYTTTQSTVKTASSKKVKKIWDDSDTAKSWTGWLWSHFLTLQKPGTFTAVYTFYIHCMGKLRKHNSVADRE